MTKKQLEVISLIYPPPIGAGLTIKEASMVLKISRGSVYQRLKNFCKKHPKAYQQIKTAKRIANRHKHELNGSAVSLNSIYEQCGTNIDGNIIERF